MENLSWPCPEKLKELEQFFESDPCEDEDDLVAELASCYAKETDDPQSLWEKRINRVLVVQAINTFEFELAHWKDIVQTIAKGKKRGIESDVLSDNLLVRFNYELGEDGVDKLWEAMGRWGGTIAKFGFTEADVITSESDDGERYEKPAPASDSTKEAATEKSAVVPTIEEPPKAPEEIPVSAVPSPTPSGLPDASKGDAATGKPEEAHPMAGVAHGKRSMLLNVIKRAVKNGYLFGEVSNLLRRSYRFNMNAETVKRLCELEGFKKSVNWDAIEKLAPRYQLARLSVSIQVGAGRGISALELLAKVQKDYPSFTGAMLLEHCRLNKIGVKGGLSKLKDQETPIETDDGASWLEEYESTHTLRSDSPTTAETLSVFELDREDPLASIDKGKRAAVAQFIQDARSCGVPSKKIPELLYEHSNVIVSTLEVQRFSEAQELEQTVDLTALKPLAEDGAASLALRILCELASGIKGGNLVTKLRKTLPAFNAEILRKHCELNNILVKGLSGPSDKGAEDSVPKESDDQLAFSFGDKPEEDGTGKQSEKEQPQGEPDDDSLSEAGSADAGDDKQDELDPLHTVPTDKREAVEELIRFASQCGVKPEVTAQKVLEQIGVELDGENIARHAATKGYKQDVDTTFLQVIYSERVRALLAFHILQFAQAGKSLAEISAVLLPLSEHLDVPGVRAHCERNGIEVKDSSESGGEDAESDDGEFLAAIPNAKHAEVDNLLRAGLRCGLTHEQLAFLVGLEFGVNPNPNKVGEYCAPKFHVTEMNLGLISSILPANQVAAAAFHILTGAVKGASVGNIEAYLQSRYLGLTEDVIRGHCEQNGLAVEDGPLTGVPIAKRDAVVKLIRDCRASRCSPQQICYIIKLAEDLDLDPQRVDAQIKAEGYLEKADLSALAPSVPESEHGPVAYRILKMIRKKSTLEDITEALAADYSEVNEEVVAEFCERNNFALTRRVVPLAAKTPTSSTPGWLRTGLAAAAVIAVVFAFGWVVTRWLGSSSSTSAPSTAVAVVEPTVYADGTVTKGPGRQAPVTGVRALAGDKQNEWKLGCLLPRYCSYGNSELMQLWAGISSYKDVDEFSEFERFVDSLPRNKRPMFARGTHVNIGDWNDAHRRLVSELQFQQELAMRR